MSRRRVLAGLAAAALTLALSACSNGSTVAAKRANGGTATASVSAGVQVVTVTTGNDLRFHPSTIVVHPGRVRVVLENTAKVGSGPQHNLYIAALGNGVPYVQAGQTAQYTFTAPSPGRYDFVCQIHATQGQTGTLVVER